MRLWIAGQELNTFLICVRTVGSRNGEERFLHILAICVRLVYGYRHLGASLGHQAPASVMLEVLGSSLAGIRDSLPVSIDVLVLLYSLYC
jgi:hypothetical protein